MATVIKSILITATLLLLIHAVSSDDFYDPRNNNHNHNDFDDINQPDPYSSSNRNTHNNHNPHSSDDVLLEFLHEPSSQLIAQDGKRAVFRCTPNPPDAEVSWLMNGQEIRERDFHGIIRIGKNRLSIKLPQVTPNDTRGETFASIMSLSDTSFQCRIRKGSHQLLSSAAKLIYLTPPSRPDISRLSEDSVMVRWNVPLNEGLKIQFFKVQYKLVAKKQSSLDWVTLDEDIAPHIHAYAVSGLKTDATYKFRIAAVYSNSDNRLSPNSLKFHLLKDPPIKKPSHGPVITSAESISPSAILLKWVYTDPSASDNSISLDGFFIHYRETVSAGEYFKVTSLGSNTRSHIITHLLPDTSYDLKIQGFNVAGASEFSNIWTNKTLGSSLSSGPSNSGVGKSDVSSGSGGSGLNVDHPTSTDQRTTEKPNIIQSFLPPVTKSLDDDRALYFVLGIAIIAMILVFVVCIVLCCVRHKSSVSQHNYDSSSVTSSDLRDHKTKFPRINKSSSNGHHNSRGGGHNSLSHFNSSSAKKERHPKAHSLHSLNHFNKLDYGNPYGNYHKTNGITANGTFGHQHNNHLAKSMNGLTIASSNPNGFLFKSSHGASSKADDLDDSSSELRVRINQSEEMNSDDDPMMMGNSDNRNVRAGYDERAVRQTLTSSTFLGERTQSTRDILRKGSSVSSHSLHHNQQQQHQQNSLAAPADQISVNRKSGEVIMNNNQKPEVKSIGVNTIDRKRERNNYNHRNMSQDETDATDDDMQQHHPHNQHPHQNVMMINGGGLMRNHNRSTSFTRLNGTLERERKRKTRNETVSTFVDMSGNTSSSCSASPSIRSKESDVPMLTNGGINSRCNGSMTTTTLNGGTMISTGVNQPITNSQHHYINHHNNHVNHNSYQQNHQQQQYNHNHNNNNNNQNSHTHNLPHNHNTQHHLNHLTNGHRVPNGGPLVIMQSSC